MPVPSVEEQRAEHFPWEDHPYYHFNEMLKAAMTPQSTVLDIGCGREANILYAFKGEAGKLIGVDVDAFTRDDPELHLYQESATSMPSVPDNSVDLAYSASLMEHIEDIDTALQEIRRVMKPGSKYIWIAPNMHHYIYYISSWVPNFLHPILVNLTEGRAMKDVFPTHYKINTKKKVFELAAKHDLTIEDFQYFGNEPQYMRFNRHAFKLGTKLEHWMRADPKRHWQLAWMVCTMTKPEPAA